VKPRSYKRRWWAGLMDGVMDKKGLSVWPDRALDLFLTWVDFLANPIATLAQAR